MHKYKSALARVLGIAAFCSSSLTLANTQTAHTGSPFDLAIANEEKLIDMLIKSGKISAGATRAEADTALRSYLQTRQQGSLILEADISESAAKLNGSQKSVFNFQKPKQHGRGKPRFGRYRPAPIESEEYSGEVRTARILSILVEFPDFPHNKVTAEDTAMYYSDYSKDHYVDLLYAKPTFAGPNGEELISVISYYEAQSGGSYSIEGTVAGWYMMQNEAAFYGGNNELTDNDSNPRALVQEALLAVDADPSINLADFDIEDRFDLDGDGDLWEPDGLVDHIQVFHSSVGEETGGGQLGPDAIWSHRWNLGAIVTMPNSPTDIPYWEGLMGAYDYTVQPIDAATGVVAHEYGHDLGLPDEYDTIYSGRGEPVSVWSIMSSGSYGGVIAGSEPTGFSPWSKEFLQASMDGNWLTGETLALETLPYYGETLLLDQAASKGTNNDVVRIDLPDKKNVIVEPYSGELAYFSGSGNDLLNIMTVEVDLSAATSAAIQFKTFYDIEQDWDYAFVLVNGEGVEGNITTAEDPFGQNFFGFGITGASDGWEDAVFDISAYVGGSVSIQVVYFTDGFVTNPGIYVDDFSVVADGEALVFDDAESDSIFTLEGFTQNPGYVYASHYYLLEWRTHSGVDMGLQNYFVAGQRLAFNEGLVVWYVDNYYSENWVGLHPGNGFLGVVDADQETNYWSDGLAASTRYQVHDAAFSFKPSDPVDIILEALDGIQLIDDYTRPFWMFRDQTDYTSPELPDAGRQLTPYGLEVRLLAESVDGSVVKIQVRKDPRFRGPAVN